MKKSIALIVTLSFMLTMAGCSKTDMEKEMAASTDNIEIVATAEAEFQNEVLKYFSDKYDMRFKLWGPEGHDLYAYYIYPDYAEWECHILMPANTDDIEQYQKDLSWKIAGDELIISGAGSQEIFQIDISMGTATSTTTGRVYQIYEMEPPLE